ncbi:MAG: putative toxin-antitoxin system toxin component, PIN family [Deltaproteobacteria bacterium]|nr:putative toxin-antitoxin system toxin component, PIN family [Deltaproteobacteria bacterium]MBI3295686.1 putative toxin-antitoxin system toxin component, PIN family [Deltaproteobacteria bacterium]
MKRESKAKPRLVLDTNVLVSGIISRKNAPGAILQAFEKKRFTLLVSEAVLDEYLRVLSYPKIRKYPQVTDSAITHIAALFVQFAEQVEVTSQATDSPDPEDNKFLNLALDGKADRLVTGDKADVLSLKEIHGIPIISPAKCVEMLGLKK